MEYHSIDLQEFVEYDSKNIDIQFVFVRCPKSMPMISGENF